MEKTNFEISDRIYKALIVLIGGLLVFLLATLLINSKNTPGNYPREITVSATGKTAVIPDIATITLGVTTEGAKVANVTSENTKKVNDILKELKALKIDEKDIKTTRYNLYPNYDWTEKGRDFLGYKLDQEITVKIRDFEKIGEVLDKSTASGANLVQDLQFVIDDVEKAKEEAINEAITKAKEKAKILARSSGLKLGKLINVYEDTYSAEPQYKYASEELGMGGGGSETPEIQPGEQEISVNMSLIYRVR